MLKEKSELVGSEMTPLCKPILADKADFGTFWVELDFWIELKH